MVEPVIEMERAKWSETCPVCGGEAKRVEPVAIFFPGVLPGEKVIFCPKHGYFKESKEAEGR